MCIPRRDYEAEEIRFDETLVHFEDSDEDELEESMRMFDDSDSTSSDSESLPEFEGFHPFSATSVVPPVPNVILAHRDVQVLIRQLFISRPNPLVPSRALLPPASETENTERTPEDTECRSLFPVNSPVLSIPNDILENRNILIFVRQLFISRPAPLVPRRALPSPTPETEMAETTLDIDNLIPDNRAAPPGLNVILANRNVRIIFRQLIINRPASLVLSSDLPIIRNRAVPPIVNRFLLPVLNGTLPSVPNLAIPPIGNGGLPTNGLNGAPPPLILNQSFSPIPNGISPLNPPIPQVRNGVVPLPRHGLGLLFPHETMQLLRNEPPQPFPNGSIPVLDETIVEFQNETLPEFPEEAPEPLPNGGLNGIVTPYVELLGNEAPQPFPNGPMAVPDETVLVFQNVALPQFPEEASEPLPNEGLNGIITPYVELLRNEAPQPFPNGSMPVSDETVLVFQNVALPQFPEGAPEPLPHGGLNEILAPYVELLRNEAPQPFPNGSMPVPDETVLVLQNVALPQFPEGAPEPLPNGGLNEIVPPYVELLRNEASQPFPNESMPVPDEIVLVFQNVALPQFPEGAPEPLLIGGLNEIVAPYVELLRNEAPQPFPNGSMPVPDETVLVFQNVALPQFPEEAPEPLPNGGLNGIVPPYMDGANLIILVFIPNNLSPVSSDDEGIDGIVTVISTPVRISQATQTSASNSEESGDGSGESSTDDNDLSVSDTTSNETETTYYSLTGSSIYDSDFDDSETTSSVRSVTSVPHVAIGSGDLLPPFDETDFSYLGVLWDETFSNIQVINEYMRVYSDEFAPSNVLEEVFAGVSDLESNVAEEHNEMGLSNLFEETLASINNCEGDNVEELEDFYIQHLFEDDFMDIAKVDDDNKVELDNRAQNNLCQQEVELDNLASNSQIEEDDFMNIPKVDDDNKVELDNLPQNMPFEEKLEVDNSAQNNPREQEVELDNLDSNIQFEEDFERSYNYLVSQELQGFGIADDPEIRNHFGMVQNIEGTEEFQMELNEVDSSNLSGSGKRTRDSAASNDTTSKDLFNSEIKEPNLKKVKKG